MKTSGKALVDHWTWAAEKGLMKPNTAKAYRAACSQILRALDNWEDVDVRELNLDNIFQRFQNKRGKDFTPESLDTYRKRFTTALESFVGYVSNPSSWKPPIKNRDGRRMARPDISAISPNDARVENSPASKDFSTSSPSPTRPNIPRTDNEARLIDYPFPLRENMIARFQLPTDLQLGEVKRLEAFLSSLVVDAK